MRVTGLAALTAAEPAPLGFCPVPPGAGPKSRRASARSAPFSSHSRTTKRAMRDAELN